MSIVFLDLLCCLYKRKILADALRHSDSEEITLHEQPAQQFKHETEDISLSR